MLTEPATARTSSTVLRGFQDGLGRRYSPASYSDDDAPLEILCIRHELAAVPSFEFALRERVARLSEFQHPYFTKIRKVDRLNDDRGTVALMSDGVSGVRLSTILIDGERTGAVINLNAGLYLVRQLLSAIVVLHKTARVAHGAIALERLFVTPHGRLCIVEYVLGAALEQLKYSRERYWKELRVAMPMDAGLPRFDERADLTQVGAVALALMLGRPLRDDEYPGQVEDLVGSASSHAVDGTREPLPLALREWLRRTLQIDVRNSFRSIAEAQNAFDQILADADHLSADAGSLEEFLARYTGSPKEPAAAAPRMPDLPKAEPTRLELPRLEPPPADESPVSASWAAPTPFESRTSEWMPETDTEELHQMRPTQQTSSGFGRFKWIAAGLLAVIATTGGLYAARHRLTPAGPPVTTGTLTVSTNPAGAEVEIDGTARGQSPISLSLQAGSHTLVVRGNGDSRTIPLNVTAGAEMSQYLEFAKTVSAVGQLNVRTEPAGARISVDGVPSGRTPLTLTDLTPGEHAITLEGDLGSVTQNVMIEAGVTSSLVVPLTGTPGAVMSGWLSVTAPVVVDLYEQGRLLGTSGIERIMLPTGRHEIEIVSEPLGYRETRSVQVSAGRVAGLNVALPKSTVSLNATPWASVSIDGESVGDTPIGNLPIAIGSHEVIFRNPELGEQRRIITVTLRSPLRLSVDMTKK